MRFNWPVSLKESKPITNSISKVVSPNSYNGEEPEVTFKQLINYHDCTPQIQIGVTAYSELITGTQMQVNSENEKAKTIIEEWNEENDFYTKFEGLVSTLLICGNAIFEKLDENKTQDVTEVDMGSIVRKKRDEFGNTLWYEQSLANGGTGKLGETSLPRFIEFNLSTYSRIPWGRSLFYSLAKSRTVGNRTLRPLVEIMWAAEDAMSTIMVNHAYPIRTITMEGANETELEKEAEHWRKFKPGDTLIRSRPYPIEHFESTETAGKYTDYITHLEKTIELGIKFPHDIMTGDFTSRASSETTENIVLKLARGFQRYLSNKLKQELYDPILQQNGIDSKKAKLQISFTTQNITNLTPDTIKFLVDSGVITKNEARIWLKDNTGMDLTDDQVISDKEDGIARNDDEKKSLKNQIDDMKEKLRLRESAEKYDKVKLTKEIMEDLKNLD